MQLYFDTSQSVVCNPIVMKSVATKAPLFCRLTCKIFSCMQDLHLVESKAVSYFFHYGY